MRPTILFALLAGILLSGCFAVTRTETDLYTITERDTTVREDMRNAPGERDNGTIYPSPRTVDINRRYLQRDSTVDRYYPAFLRFGGFEAASFLAPGSSGTGASSGLFGLYDLLINRDSSASRTFGAYMYRFVPYEIRLRWFDDAPNWTLGTSAFEMFIYHRDSLNATNPGEGLFSFLNGYIRHRFFFREEPPYVMLVPFVGASLFPSQYVNLGATLDVGSYGGFNIRAYAGVISGTTGFARGFGNDLNAFELENSDFSVTFPYFGIGVSTLDFVNKTEELFIEWKDHDHSALEVSLANLDLVYSTSGQPSIFELGAADTRTSFPTGIWLRLGSATWPLPIGTRQLFVGTSLFNMMLLSQEEFGLGFLPLRAGYRFHILEDALKFEPFAEFNYYPSTIFTVGARSAIKVSKWFQAEALIGYSTGSTGLDVLLGLEEAFDTFEDLNEIDNFSTFFMGVGVGIGDVFHTPEVVMRK